MLVKCHDSCILQYHMKVRELRWLFIAVIVTLIVVANFGKPMSFGVSAETVNGRYSFSGGTSPIALILALLVILLYVLLIYSAPPSLGKPLSGVFRRFIAFWLDFVIAMISIGPILGIFPMLTEWKRTGVFQWSFERPTREPGDELLATIALVICAAGLTFYYALPLIRRRPSPGSCIVGYQVVCDEGISLTLRAVVLRTLLGFIAAAAAYLAPFVGRDKKRGKFWLDKVFGTYAVKLG